MNKDLISITLVALGITIAALHLVSDAQNRSSASRSQGTCPSPSETQLSTYGDSLIRMASKT